MNIRRKFYAVFMLLVIASLSLIPMTALAEVQYNTFTKNKFGHTVWTKPAYYPIEIYGDNLYVQGNDDPDTLTYSPLKNPQDVFIDRLDHIYIADTGNNRIVHLDAQGNWIRYVTLPDSPLNNPHGIFVTDEGIIYVADTGNRRIVKIDQNGDMLTEFPEPVSRFIPDDYSYDPIKLIVDRRGYLYIVTLGGYQGLLQLTPEGNFSSFYGTNLTEMSIVDHMKRAVYTREMWANEIRKLPGSIRNVAMDANGFIYTVTSGVDIKEEQVKKLNIEGKNILSQYNKFGNEKKSYGELPHYATRAMSSNNTLDPQLIDVAVDQYGNITVVDVNFNVISHYDANGELLYFWGGKYDVGTTQLGLVRNAIAVDINSRNELFVLDNQENLLHRFALSEFGKLVSEANALTMDGFYEESEELWKKVLLLNAQYGPAIEGVAMAAYKKEEYKRASELFFQSGNQEGYSDAFWQIRLEWFQKNFSWFASFFVIIFFVMMSFDKMTNRMKFRKLWQQRERSKKPLVIQLKHAFTILKRPLEGFSDLREEQKGSYLSAFIILALTLIALLVSKMYTSFTFNLMAPFKVNFFNVFMSFSIAWFGWVVCNYLMSSILRGEGRFKDVFIGSAYALTPLIIIGIPLTLLTNIMTASESAIYNYLYYGMIVWIVLLFFWMVQSLQNYTVGETISNVLLTMFSMIILGILVFIMIGLTNELRLFIYEVYQEVTLR